MGFAVQWTPSSPCPATGQLVNGSKSLPSQTLVSQAIIGAHQMTSQDFCTPSPRTQQGLESWELLLPPFLLLECFIDLQRASHAR